MIENCPKTDTLVASPYPMETKHCVYEVRGIKDFVE